MASNFQVWIDSATDDNTMSSSELSSDTQRINGFQPSQPASSKRVNSMLRQSSLVNAALMDIIDPSGTTTLRSSKSDVETLLTNYFVSISRNVVTVTFTDSQGGTRALVSDKMFGEVVNDYNAGKTITAKFGIYENFALVGVQKIAGQIGKFYFAYIDDEVIKIIDFDTYGGEIYTNNIVSLINSVSNGLQVYTGNVTITDSRSFTFRLRNGNGTYKLIEMTFGDAAIITTQTQIKFVYTGNPSMLVEFGNASSVAITSISSDGTITITLPPDVASSFKNLTCFYTIFYTFS